MAFTSARSYDFFHLSTASAESPATRRPVASNVVEMAAILTIAGVVMKMSAVTAIGLDRDVEG
jgi:hypothetical protein